MLKVTLLITALALGAVAVQPASAACYADYKAKKLKPFKLHYGVIKIPNKICSNNAKIRKNVARRIRVDGWRLLNVMSVFGPEGLKQRQQNARRFFLKY